MPNPSGEIQVRNKVWPLMGIAVAVAAVIIIWQRFAAPAPSAAGRPVEKAAADKPAASDAITVNEDQLKQISTDMVREHMITIDRKATGKVGFNEDRLTPVFTPFSGRLVELLANKGDKIWSGQPLAVIESADF